MSTYQPKHQGWHDLLDLECTCDEAWVGRGMVDDRCWYHRTIDVLDDRDMGRLLGHVLYKVCPDCNGNGSIYTMDSTPSLNEYEQECLRCRAFGGFVQAWPEQQKEFDNG